MQQTVTDCRVYERHACQVPTSCQPAAANETRWDATIENISQSGLRVRLRRRFEPRSALAVELPGRDGQDASTVYVKVVHVTNEGEGFYALGCKLMSELSEDELGRLLTFGGGESCEPDETPEPERTVVASVRLEIAVGRGQVVRCQVKRMHVAAEWPMAHGAVLNLQGVAADGSRLEHPFEILYCLQEGDGWVLRIRPVKPDGIPDWVQRRIRHSW